MSFNPNMSNKDVANLVFLNYSDKKRFLDLDYANVTTTGLEATREYATGGQGAPNRITFDGGRKGTLKIETQIGTMKLFSMLSGDELKSTFKYMKRIKVTCDSATAITIPSTYSPITGSVQVASVNDPETDITVTVSGNEITGSSLSGDYYVYFMEQSTSGKSVSFNSTHFPKAYQIYGETPWKTENDEIADMHLTYYKASPQSQFELAFSNTGIINMSITFDLLVDGDGNLFDMSIDDSND